MLADFLIRSTLRTCDSLRWVRLLATGDVGDRDFRLSLVPKVVGDRDFQRLESLEISIANGFGRLTPLEIGITNPWLADSPTGR